MEIISESTAYKKKGEKHRVKGKNSKETATPGSQEVRESIGSIIDLKLSELGKTASGYSVSSSDSRIKLVAKKSALHSFQIEEPNNNDIKAKRCWPSFVTIITFLVSEQSKKKKSF
jgi:hypothetical protein